MAEFRYAKYPDAKVCDDDEKEINHLLFGDWVRIEGAVQNGLGAGPRSRHARLDA